MGQARRQPTSGLAGGLFLAVPDTINSNSPVFKEAGVACHFG
jgi:hypothetical protein